MSVKDRRALAALALGLLTIWAYRTVVGAGFVYEDHDWLPWHPKYEWPGLVSFVQGLPWQILSTFADGRAWVLHASLLGVHLVNGWLFWRVVSRWSESVAWGAVAFFLLHPLNVEAVAYLSGSRESLACLCLLIAIDRGLSPTETPIASGLLVVAMTAIGAVMKPSAVMVIGLVPLALWIFAPRRLSFSMRAGFIAVLGVLLIPLTAWVGELAARHLVRLDLHSVWTTASSNALALWRLLALALVPMGLSIDHDYFGASFGLRVIAIAAVGVALIVMVAGRSRYPIGAAVIAWLTIALAPRFVIQQVDPLNEHHVLIPCLAVWIVLGIGASRLWARVSDAPLVPVLDPQGVL